MLKKMFYVVSVLAFTVTLALPQGKGGGKAAPKGPGMGMTSPDFEDGGIIPDKFTQAVPMPVSPRLEWTNVPPGTESFVLIMHDTDGAPMKTSMDTTHWTVYNIPGTATSLPEGVQPGGPVAGDGIQGKNVRGVNGYQPPCPPKGGPAHHYVIELFALDTKIDLPAGAPRADILKAIDGHVIGKSSYVGKFKH